MAMGGADFGAYSQSLCMHSRTHRIAGCGFRCRERSGGVVWMLCPCVTGAHRSCPGMGGTKILVYAPRTVTPTFTSLALALKLSAVRVAVFWGRLALRARLLPLCSRLLWSKSLACGLGWPLRFCGFRQLRARRYLAARQLRDLDLQAFARPGNGSTETSNRAPV